MGSRLYGFGSAGGGDGWGAHDPASLQSSGPEIDGLLAGAGYRVRSSDLRHVAQSLERLDSAMVAVADASSSSSAAAAAAAAPEAVHYNPSDLTAWVDSMLSEVNPTNAAAGPEAAFPPPQRDAWTALMQQQQIQMAAAAAAARRRREEEEDSGIRLVHLLMSCADAVQRGDAPLAGSLVDEMRLLLLAGHVNTAFGIGKVAGYFADALFRRLYLPSHPEPPLSSAAAAAAAASSSSSSSSSPGEHEILYHHFYEACPYLKFAHFTANQAILEAFDGHDRVHVVDFSLMQGLQWPALIQALALRPGGPPFLRLTGIGPPSADGRDELREVGLRLAELARSVRVRFAFRGVAAARLDDVRPWMLQVARGEAVAVNSVLQLHRLLVDPAPPVESVLRWVVGLRPKIVTVVEQEADHNSPAFLDRFTEALFYYSTVFDSLEAAGSAAPHHPNQQSSLMAEMYLQREICNIVCCEGADRVERHEPLGRWRARLTRAGLTPVHLGSNAFKQASMLLTLFSGEGYSVDEVDGCLTLGWHNRPLISASAWRADAADVASDDTTTLVPNINNNNNNNNRHDNHNNNNNNLYIIIDNNNNNNNNNNSAQSNSSSSNNNNSSTGDVQMQQERFLM